MKLRPGGKLLIIVLLFGAIFLAFMQVKKLGLLDDLAATPTAEQKPVAVVPPTEVKPAPQAVVPTPVPTPQTPTVAVAPPAPKVEPTPPVPQAPPTPKKEDKGTGAADNVFGKIGKL